MIMDFISFMDVKRKIKMITDIRKKTKYVLILILIIIITK